MKKKITAKLKRKRLAYYRQRAGRHFEKGDPRYTACYKDGDEGDCYTVVFTRSIGSGYQRSFQFVGMSASPFHPQGVGQHGEHGTRIDKPSYRHLGKRIGFRDLPEDCKRLVKSDYRELYDL